MSLSRDELFDIIDLLMKTLGKDGTLPVDSRFKVKGPFYSNHPADNQTSIWLALDHFWPGGTCASNAVELLVSEMQELPTVGIIAYVIKKLMAANSELVAFTEKEK